jgi:ammonium transporter, Amt family
MPATGNSSGNVKSTKVSLGFLAAYPLVAGQRKGLFYGGGIEQLGVQALGPVAVGLYSFAVAWILGKIIDKTMGFRISEEDELAGIDIAEHAETAYELGGFPQAHAGAIHVAGAHAASAHAEAALAEAALAARADREAPTDDTTPVAGPR